MSTADKLQRFSTARSNTKKSIKNKGVDATGHGFEAFPSDIDLISTGGGSSTSVEDADVRFIDYDGTVVYGYTADEFLELSEMPENPIHAGLTSQGWNWTLADAKAYVNKYGMLDIGQMYITDDGSTRLYVHFEEGYQEISPYLCMSINGTVTVDWGDGSSTDTVTGSSLSSMRDVQHTFQPGDYVISVTPDDGSVFTFYGRYNSSNAKYSSEALINAHTVMPDMELYIQSIIKVETGNGFYFSDCTFSRCCNIESITMSNNIIFNESVMYKGGGGTFRHCYHLNSITIPNGNTVVPQFFLNDCSSLKSVSLPNNLNILRMSCFSNCSSLYRVTTPNSVTSIESSVFANCYNLNDVILPPNITIINSSTFSGCRKLSSIIIPNNVTSLESYSFANCNCLKNITLPEGLVTIGTYAFSADYGLSNLVIPSTVTTIYNNNCIFYCYSLLYLKFTSSVPPNIKAKSTYDLNPVCKIYVPEGSLSAYTSATNYPDPNTYTYIEY